MPITDLIRHLAEYNIKEVQFVPWILNADIAPATVIRAPCDYLVDTGLAVRLHDRVCLTMAPTD